MSNHHDGKVRRRSSEEIIEILGQYRDSGLTAVAFCEQQRLNAGTFHTWKKRYRRNANSSTDKNGFVKFQMTDALPGLFAEVGIIRLYQPVSADFLKSLLA